MHGTMGPLKMEIYEKQSGNKEFMPKTGYHQILSSFGHHALVKAETLWLIIKHHL